MVEIEQEVVNELGLHARAAAKLVHTASQYSSRVTLVKDGEEVDAKSILGLLLLAAAKGSTVRIRCEGPDEGEACRAVIELFRNYFDEGR